MTQRVKSAASVCSRLRRHERWAIYAEPFSRGGEREWESEQRYAIMPTGVLQSGQPFPERLYLEIENRKHMSKELPKTREKGIAFYCICSCAVLALAFLQFRIIPFLPTITGICSYQEFRELP